MCIMPITQPYQYNNKVIGLSGIVWLWVAWLGLTNTVLGPTRLIMQTFVDMVIHRPIHFAVSILCVGADTPR